MLSAWTSDTEWVGRILDWMVLKACIIQWRGGNVNVCFVHIHYSGTLTLVAWDRGKPVPDTDQPRQRDLLLASMAIFCLEMVELVGPQSAEDSQTTSDRVTPWESELADVGPGWVCSLWGFSSLPGTCDVQRKSENIPTTMLSLHHRDVDLKRGRFLCSFKFPRLLVRGRVVAVLAERYHPPWVAPLRGIAADCHWCALRDWVSLLQLALYHQVISLSTLLWLVKSVSTI